MNNLLEPKTTVTFYGRPATVVKVRQDQQTGQWEYYLRYVDASKEFPNEWVNADEGVEEADPSVLRSPVKPGKNVYDKAEVYDALKNRMDSVASVAADIFKKFMGDSGPIESLEVLRALQGISDKEVGRQMFIYLRSIIDPHIK
jgi:hypothetical protein